MPRPKKGGAPSLNLLGEWINTFAMLLQTTATRIALLSGISRSTMSAMTHSQEGKSDTRPHPDHVSTMWKTIQSFALEQYGRTYPEEIKEGFENAAGLVSSGQADLSSVRLNRLQDLHDPQRIISALIEEKEEQIRQLQGEIDELSRSLNAGKH